MNGLSDRKCRPLLSLLTELSRTLIISISWSDLRSVVAAVREALTQKATAGTSSSGKNSYLANEMFLTTGITRGGGRCDSDVLTLGELQYYIVKQWNSQQLLKY